MSSAWGIFKSCWPTKMTCITKILFFKRTRTQRSFFILLMGLAIFIALLLIYECKEEPLNTKFNRKIAAYFTKDPIQDATEKVYQKIQQQVQSKLTKVLLMTQERGGGTFLSELFIQNVNACFWFEPEFSIYKTIYGVMPVGSGHPDELQFTEDGTLRMPTTYESVWMTYYLSAILNNNIRGLSKRIWYDRFTLGIDLDNRTQPLIRCVTHKGDSKLRNDVTCRGTPQIGHFVDCYSWNGSVSTVDHGKVLDESKVKCVEADGYLTCGSILFDQFAKEKDSRCRNVVESMSNQCNIRQITALKLHRLRMEYAKPILQNDPTVKIIHYVRDPRGILSSRKKIHSADMVPPMWAKGSWTTYAAGLCTKLLDDARIVNKLLEKYPNNILTVHYENLATEPLKYAKKIYDFIGHKLPRSVSLWLMSATGDTNRKKEPLFKPVRKNSIKTAHAWRKYWSKKDIKAMSTVCRSCLEELGYPLE